MPYKEPQHPSELTPWDRKILREVFYGSTQIAVARKHRVPPLRVHTIVNSPGGKAFLANMENQVQAKASDAAEELTGGSYSDDPQFSAATEEAVTVLLTVLRTGRSLRDRLASAERIIRLNSEMRRQAAAGGGPIVQVTQQQVNELKAGILGIDSEERTEWLRVRDDFLAWLRVRPECYESALGIVWMKRREDYTTWRAEHPDESLQRGEVIWWDPMRAYGTTNEIIPQTYGSDEPGTGNSHAEGEKTCS